MTLRPQPGSSIDLDLTFCEIPQGEAISWLSRRKGVLEGIVEPFILDEETNIRFTFKGRLRYVDPKIDGQPLFAIKALACIYDLERAIEAADVDSMLRLMSTFTENNREVDDTKLWGRSNIEAQLNVLSKQAKRADIGRMTKLRNVPDLVLQATFQRNKSRKNPLGATAAELKRQYNFPTLTSKTVSAELKKRGFLE